MVGKKKTRRRGFSLLELMLVLAIMGILMAVVAYNVMGQGEKAKVSATKTTLRMVQNCLNQYNLENSCFPATLQQLIVARILDNKPIQDGWKNDLMYNPNGASKDQPYDLFSAGPDKVIGTEDDISVWMMDGPAPVPTH